MDVIIRTQVNKVSGWIAALSVCLGIPSWAESPRPHPVNYPESPLMLDLPSVGTDPTKIDFAKLPRLNGQHAVISRGDDAWKFRLHNYLAHFDGKFWCIWSHGPVIEDKATQHVRFATSRDGLHWNDAQQLTPPPPKGCGYIARGLWIRNGQLLALASLFEAPSAFGGRLELHAFAWDKETTKWRHAGLVMDDAINNFPPKKLPTGDWMMSRRDHRHNVSMLIGGVKSLSKWRVIPVASHQLPDGGRPEEPFWWALRDGNLVGLFRDNADSNRLYRAFSTDSGQSWTTPVRTNFPDARSKFNALRTSRGYWVLVSNPNPAGRNPLCLSTSDDGLVFTRMAALRIPSKRGDTLQYPHVIEHERRLYIAFSRNKTAIEVLTIELDEVNHLRK
ncbi:MAG: exo-alpha-sialidase [Pirellulales bacterium]